MFFIMTKIEKKKAPCGEPWNKMSNAHTYLPASIAAWAAARRAMGTLKGEQET